MNATIPLGKVVEIRIGGAPRRSATEYWGGSIPLATVDDINSTSLETARESVTREGVANSTASVVPAGSILVPTRKVVGEAAINAVEMAIGNYVIAILPGEDVNNRFLLHFVRSNARFLNRQAQRNSLQAFGSKHLLSLEFPIMRLDEQRRIAEILDTVDRMRSNCEKMEALVEKLTESSFLDSFGDPALNPKDWPEYKLEDLGELRFVMQRPSNWEGRLSRKPPFPSVHANDFSESDRDQLAEGAVAEVGHDAKDRGREMLREGDVLIVKRHPRSGEIGRAAVWDASMEDNAHHANLMRFRVDQSRALPGYISGMLNSRGGRRRLIPYDVELLQPFGISAGMVREMAVPVPPIENQRRFAKLLDKCRRIACNAERGRRNAKELFASLSSRAFRGEL